MNQFGYRKGRSTELVALLLTDEVSKEIEKGKIVGALFIDLSKAFDTLGHSILISKVRSCGLTGLCTIFLIAPSHVKTVECHKDLY